jgi:hypothetical protein
VSQHTGSEWYAAMRGLTGLASTAIMGVVALCNEMALEGILDARGVDRISELMLHSIETSGANDDVQAKLTDALTEQFADLSRNLDRLNP